MSSIAPSPSPSRILVLGVGNILWADEGFGVRAAELLAGRWACGPDVDIVDGGTRGLYLVEFLRAARACIIFDAVDFGAAPASLVEKRNEEVPRFIGQHAISLHQQGVEDVLACAELMGGAPADLYLIGCQPVELEDYGGSLTDPVKAQLEPAVDLALAQLRAWGINPVRRADDAAFLSDALSLDRYESERPSAAAACRIGDGRLLGTGA